MQRCSRGFAADTEVDPPRRKARPVCRTSRAVEKGHKAVVKLLLNTGKVEADSKDGDGRTPLSWAAGNGHEAVVKLLLDIGKVEADSKDSNGRNAAVVGCRERERHNREHLCYISLIICLEYSPAIPLHY